MSKIIQGKFRILSNKKVGLGYFKMTVFAPPLAQAAQPGQFVHLRCNDSINPLLRRPLSFHRLNKDNFELLYQIVGRGTNLLAKKQKGDKIDILGPLGTGFPLNQSTIDTTVLVAGGMGVAPLLALAESLSDRKKALVLIGAKTKDAVLCAEDFRRLGAKVRIATDDGSKGSKGPVTALLSKFLKQSAINYKLSTIYACGPKPMLQEIARISRKAGVPAYASLEENMACGVGACLGCAVKTKAGYKRVCKDGPVFNLEEIKW